MDGCSGNGDSRQRTTVAGDDAVAARLMLDGLLGGRPERLALLAGTACLGTPRGLEAIDLVRMRRLPRVELGCRLLGIAETASSVIMLDELGRLSSWSPSSTRQLLVPSGAAPYRLIAGQGQQVVLGRGNHLALLDARDGSHLAEGRLDLPGHLSAVGWSGEHAVLAAFSQTVSVVERDGDQLAAKATCRLGDGEVLAVSETTFEDRRVVVAYDEFGWLYALRREPDGTLVRLGAIDLELDGGVPERAGLLCDGPQVMIASGTRLLHVVDLRPPPGHEDPMVMATVSVGTGLTDVKADDSRVYLADSYQGLVVLDRALLEICHDDPVVQRVSLIELLDL